MTKIAAIDVETSSLRHDRRAWEVALIVREPGQPDREYLFLVDTDDLDLGNADLYSLKIGRFHERHPQWNDQREGMGLLAREAEVLRRVEELTRGAHLVGAVVSFDAEVLANRMRANGICPSWHYHLIDIEPMAVGYLQVMSRWVNSRAEGDDEVVARANALLDATAPPWKSDALSRACGVEPASEQERHTALGDARWALRLFDAITSGGGRS